MKINPANDEKLPSGQVPFRFETIQFPRDYEICLENRRDSYVVSFGNATGFDRDMESYRRRMQERVASLPEGNCHLWANGGVVGQLEMKLPADPDIAYVSLFYLVPTYRNQGYGHFLQDYAVKVSRALNRTCIHLSVSPSNHQALAFYRKLGWKNNGPRPGREKMHLMSLSL